MKRSYYPFPADIIMTHTGYRTCSPVTKAAVWDVCWLLWCEGFKRVPNDAQIKYLSNIPQGLYDRYESDLNYMLVDIIPALQAVYVKKDKLYQMKKYNAVIAQELSVRKSRERKREASKGCGLVEEQNGLSNFSKVSFSKKFHEGYNDKHKQQEILANRNQQPGKTFTDN